MATFPQWEYDLLSALGAPTSVNNLTALNLWAQSEGNVVNNPLATSGRGAGASTCVAQCGSSSPIYEYATEAEGVSQMSRFLGGSYYTAIVSAFRSDAGLAAIYSAINASPWCKGCQNGRYPEALAGAVDGKAPATSATVGGGPAGYGPNQNPPPGGGSSSTSGQKADLSACVIQFPGFLFFSGPCILTKGGVKWLTGVASLVFGAGVFTFGVVMLAAWGFDRSGAKQAVTSTARKVGIGASLLTGQPEVAAGLKATSRSSSSRSLGLGPSARPDRPRSGQPRTAGRLESASIERRFRELQRQTGPIGPRGASPTSTRVAQGRSVAGPGRRPGAEQRRRAQETNEQRRARHRAEGFERVS